MVSLVSGTEQRQYDVTVHYRHSDSISNDVAIVVIGTPGAKAAQAVVTRENDRDMIRLSLVLEDGADASAAEAAAADTFKLHARIRADEVNIVSELPENAELIVNQNDR